MKSNLSKIKVKTRHSTPLTARLLPFPDRAVLLLYLGGERGGRGRPRGVLTTVKIYLNIFRDVGSALVIGLHFPQSLFVFVLGDVLHEVPDVSGEHSGCDVFMDDLSDLYLRAVCRLCWLEGGQSSFFY